jgi:hypothetical protein
MEFTVVTLPLSTALEVLAVCAIEVGCVWSCETDFIFDVLTAKRTSQYLALTHTHLFILGNITFSLLLEVV